MTSDSEEGSPKPVAKVIPSGSLTLGRARDSGIKESLTRGMQSRRNNPKELTAHDHFQNAGASEGHRAKAVKSHKGAKNTHDS